MSSLPDNHSVLSVGDLTRRIKAVLERQISACWVRGEISNFRCQQSGHWYFTLKDKDSQLPCVMFRGDAIRQSVEPLDGRQILVYGSLSLYEPRGAYQFICRELVEDGMGRLQREFERLKAKLAAEGLFDPARKQKLPLLPRTVAVITSPSGAALRDFISILQRRHWQGRVIIIPAKVQGQGAAEEIAAGITAATGLGFVDLLVLTRGGGSLEDLWCFNEEIVARALAACPLPTLSAVGHEIDFTLADFAADKRAETPSAAAELITSAWVRCMERLRTAAKGLNETPLRVLERQGNRLKLAASAMLRASPRQRLERGMLELDELGGRLGITWREGLLQRQSALDVLARRLAVASPQRRLELESLRLRGLQGRFSRLLDAGVINHHEKLKHISARLDNSSLPRALGRGFVVVRDHKGSLVRRREGLKSGDALALDFADGEIHVRVDNAGRGGA